MLTSIQSRSISTYLVNPKNNTTQLRDTFQLSNVCKFKKRCIKLLILNGNHVKNFTISNEAPKIVSMYEFQLPAFMTEL